ncbi:hypothetical protein Fokcrypt_00650 [Candidatus Fokinia cryptica]|uniref:Uncharacterized protein n=1 Tax=Candidatus Fokinia crypta TaxID=1920990 RepID=A0ABZ0US76_9RICK|nr:hypothetical protein Fokcrypt_00650 [Candidatus Fokinia cryptica]
MFFNKMLSSSFWCSMGQKSMLYIEDTARKLLLYIDKKQFNKSKISSKGKAKTLTRKKQSSKH